MPLTRLFSRLCAVGLMMFATLMILAASFEAPVAQADHHASAMPAMPEHLSSRPTVQHTSPAPAAPSGLVDVAIFDFGFNPETITITAGSTVRWTNTASPTPHTTTSDLGDTEVWDSGILNPGGVFTHTFDTPGIYGYYCMIHGALVMHGFVVVSQPPAGVDIAGPGAGEHGNPYTFTAAVNPITTTLPITFSWEATNQLPVTHVNTAVSDTQVFTGLPA